MLITYGLGCFFFNAIIISTINGASVNSPDKYTIETTTEDFSIIGGEAVNIKDVPYQVSLQFNGGHVCGGSVIAANIILTAGHCVEGKSNRPGLFQVRAGSSKHSTGGVLVKVVKILMHPKYVHYPQHYMDNDVAVVWLAQNLQGDGIRSISMASKGAELGTGSNMLATGWGRLTSNDPSPSNSLQKVYVPTVSPQTCNKYYKGIITNTMLCAGPDQGGKGVCRGDSGGPLVQNGVLYGVVSWSSTQCAGPRLPGVYAKVSALRDWIDRAVSGGI